MKKIFAILSFTLAAGFLISGCSGSSSSSAPASAVSFNMPSAISPVPTTATGVAASKLAKGVSLGSMLAGVAATDPGTDYSNATTSKHVEEHVLSQFSIINTILDAMSQTHFSDTANIGQGPYKALIAWKEDNGGGGPQGGGGQKKLQTWVVDSSLIVENGQNVNQFLAWIQDEQNGTPVVITVKVKIYTSPTLKTDGSYQDYGVWTLNATFGGQASRYFSAAASIDPNGKAVIKFHDTTQGANNEVKAILNTSNGSGFGQIAFPDFSNCNTWPCVGTPVTASYVYDASAVAVSTTSNNVTTTSYKDRANKTDFTTYYGLYDSVTGADVLKTKTFGFPVKYTDSNNVDQMAYYGSWQGRHSLWTNGGGSVPAGTQLTRMDLGANQTETYTLTNASNFSGSLTKRTLVASDINNILNLPVNTWVNNSYPLYWDNVNLVWCTAFLAAPPGSGNNCGGGTQFTAFSTLVADPVSNVNINISASNGSPVTLTSDPTNNVFKNGGSTYSGTNLNDQVYVNIGGSIYIEYTNKGPVYNTSGNPVWVKKKLTKFDQQTWTPTFDDNADTAYPLGSGQQYYLMNQGTNFIYTNGQNSTSFQIEVQTVANPVNATTFTGSGTVFTPQWSNTGSSSYSFVTDKNDSTRFLYLIYKTIGSNDASKTSLITSQTIQVGDIVTEGIYGLVANDGTQYNWDYTTPQNPYGLLTYLVGPSPSGNYKLLDDPIALQSFQVTNVDGANSITVSPMYSGWMSGIPDVYNDLRMTDWIMTPDIHSKVYNIPAGTVTDANTNQQYLIMPLNISEFLNPLSSNPGLDLTLANSADLTTVPTLVDPAMGTMPNITTIKYSEGKLIQ